MDKKQLETIRRFKNLSRDTIQYILNCSAQKTLEQGQILFQQSSNALCFYILINGYVKIMRESQSGQKVLLDIFGPGDSPGELALSFRHYPANAISLTPLIFLRMHKADYANLRKSKTDFEQSIALTSTRQLENHLAKAILRAEVNTQNRIIGFFTRLCLQHGQSEQDKIRLPYPLSRSDIANTVGCRTETVIRLIRKWERQNLFITQNDGFLIHRQLLRNPGDLICHPY